MKLFSILISVLILTAVFINPQTLRAQEVVCTSGYGQPVVCGTATDEEIIHEPVDTGLADIDIRVLAAGLLTVSAGAYAVNKSREKALN